MLFLLFSVECLPVFLSLSFSPTLSTPAFFIPSTVTETSFHTSCRLYTPARNRKKHTHTHTRGKKHARTRLCGHEWGIMGVPHALMGVAPGVEGTTKGEEPEECA